MGISYTNTSLNYNTTLSTKCVTEIQSASRLTQQERSALSSNHNG